jgi:hypothetical protein
LIGVANEVVGTALVGKAANVTTWSVGMGLFVGMAVFVGSTAWVIAIPVIAFAMAVFCTSAALKSGADLEAQAARTMTIIKEIESRNFLFIFFSMNGYFYYKARKEWISGPIPPTPAKYTPPAGAIGKQKSQFDKPNNETVK